MRTPLLLVLAVVAAGCAGGEGGSPGTVADPDAGAAPDPEPAASAPPPASPPAPTAQAAAPGDVLYERAFSFASNSDEVREKFLLPRGTQKIVLHIESAGPPDDDSFTSAVMDLYPPGYTSPLFAEMPGEEARSYSREMYAEGFWGEWTVRYAGTGKTSVSLRAVAG